MEDEKEEEETCVSLAHDRRIHDSEESKRGRIKKKELGGLGDNDLETITIID